MTASHSDHRTCWKPVPILIYTTTLDGVAQHLPQDGFRRHSEANGQIGLQTTSAARTRQDQHALQWMIML